MDPRLRKAGGWLYRRAENVITAMLAVMFFTFLLQILFRYVLNWQTGWTHELSVVLWIWIFLFGSAFVVTEQEEMRFDLLYASAGPRMRGVMFLVFAAAVLFLYTISLPAVIDYVTFMKVERSAYLKIRFDYLYSIYVVFAVAMIVRYIWIAWLAVRGEAPEAYDPTKASSGV